MADNAAVEVRAESPGIVIRIAVEPGAQVQIDDELLIVECMKLEIPVAAPRGGTVRNIEVGVGDRIEEDDLLLVLTVAG
jgi:biotin carboxyl carrier protein